MDEIEQLKARIIELEAELAAAKLPFIINPDSGRKVRKGSRTWKKLVREGVITVQ